MKQTIFTGLDPSAKELTENMLRSGYMDLENGSHGDDCLTSDEVEEMFVSNMRSMFVGALNAYGLDSSVYED
jgi:hypothetical protein